MTIYNQPEQLGLRLELVFTFSCSFQFFALLSGVYFMLFSISDTLLSSKISMVALQSDNQASNPLTILFKITACLCPFANNERLHYEVTLDVPDVLVR